jgi:hypothetical protein
LQGGSQGAGVDTVVAGAHFSDYSSSQTRGWWFQAQSSYTISGVHCSDDNTAGAVLGTNQSVEIIDFGALLPVVFPGPGGPYTTLFSAIDTAEGWIACNVNIVNGNYYGVIGAKHAPVLSTGPIQIAPIMYNSYGSSGAQTFTIDGHPTIATRLLLQSALSLGSPISGSYMSEPNGSIGRVNIITGGGVNWYDVSTGQMIGGGDTLNYAPSQSTFVTGVITDSIGQLHSDTMHLEVLNTAISTSGFSLCNGPLVLTAPATFSNYVWSNGASTSSILTVNTPGTYYVDCIMPNGMTCQSPPITIYQDTIPISLSTPDSVFICQGDTVIIDGPLGFSQYNWSTVASIPSITTTITGNYSLTVTDGNGCIGVSNTTTIDISPQTITATTTGYSLCNGSVTLNAGSGFASYQWFNNGIMQILGSSQTYIVNNAGVYHCEVVYPTGCTAISNLMTIVAGTGAFNVSISAIGNDSLCGPNDQVVLDAGNYASFIWNTGDTTQQIMVSNLGVYTVDVLDSIGCQGSSIIGYEVFNTVNTSSISGSTTPTQFQTEIYQVLSTPGSTYNWDVGLGIILAGNGTFAIQVEYGSSSVGNFEIYVIETNSDGCVGDTIFLSVSVLVSAVEEVDLLPHKLLKVRDLLGRETKQAKQPLFYIYDDGKVEKRIIIE